MNHHKTSKKHQKHQIILLSRFSRPAHSILGFNIATKLAMNHYIPQPQYLLKEEVEVVEVEVVEEVVQAFLQRQQAN